MGQQTTAPDDGRAAAKRRMRPVWIVAAAVAVVVACIVFVPRRGPPSEVWVRDNGVPLFGDLTPFIAETPGGDPPDVWWINAFAGFPLVCCERNPHGPIGEVLGVIAEPVEHWYESTAEERVVDGRRWRRHRFAETRPYSPIR